MMRKGFFFQPRVRFDRQIGRFHSPRFAINALKKSDAVKDLCKFVQFAVFFCILFLIINLSIFSKGYLFVC